MEASKEEEGLFDQIRPPRLVDAGLEDCALPPESIKEAFLKAATAVRSAASIFSSEEESEGGCTNDPLPEIGDLSDACVGIVLEKEVPRSCAAEKGGGVPDETIGDEVAVVDGEKKVDKVVEPSLPDHEDEKSCVDVLQGLEIGSKNGGIKVNGSGKVEGKDNKDGDKPILVEGYVL